MTNYLVEISYDWKVIILVVRSDTRNHANKIASKWLKANHPKAVGNCSFEIHDFTNEGEGVVFNNILYLD